MIEFGFELRFSHNQLLLRNDLNQHVSFNSIDYKQILLSMPINHGYMYNIRLDIWHQTYATICSAPNKLALEK